MTQLQALLSQIDSGTMMLPEFQRGYVWNRDQVRGLLRSLYLGYPVGGLLVWETETSEDDVRGTSESAGIRSLLLDGQQRLTSIYGVSRGRPPKFFEGDERAFLGLHFNVEDETFEFYAPAKMKDDYRWINVTTLFQNGVAAAMEKIEQSDTNFYVYLERISSLDNVMKREFHIEKIVGADKTTDIVVDIFNRVNSGGTTLSKGDLALAKISAQAPELRNLMRTHIERWNQAGYEFKLDWFLRSINAVATGKALFLYLDDVKISEIEDAIHKTVKYIDEILNVIASRLGLDHNRVLVSRYAIPVLCLYLHKNSGKWASQSDQNKALYWYVHAGLWGRFSGSTESVLSQDYETLSTQGLDGLIGVLARSRGGSLDIAPSDFTAMGLGSRFYPLLYLLTRVGLAQDFGNGLPLKQQLLGKLASLQVHHIFPKRVLYDYGYSKSEVNAIANFCFLTQESNLYISKREPMDYFVECNDERGFVEALPSQWIPMERSLWQIENYPEFLAARRVLLAKAANEFLEKLKSNNIEASSLPSITLAQDEEIDPRDSEISAALNYLANYGVAEPERDIEVFDPETGQILCAAECFWESGLQPGIGEPTVLELDPEDSDIERLAALGYRVFTTIKALKDYVERNSRKFSGLED